MKRWILLLTAVATLAALALTTRWWLSPLLRFLNANTDVIQGAADLVQIVLWLIAGAALLLGFRWQRQSDQRVGTSPTTEANVSEQSVSAQNRSVAAGQIAIGRDNLGDVIVVADADALWRHIRQRKPDVDLRQATQAYLEHLVDRFRYLDFRGMGTFDSVPLRLPLTEMYVPLQARIELPRGETWQRLHLAGRRVSEDEAEIIGRASEARPLLELFRHNDGLIVLGDPGAGKTTFLKYVTLMLALGEGERLGLRPQLPVLVPLSAYANALAEGDLPLDRFIARYYQERGVEFPLAAMLDEALEQGGALLLLDGLDEVKEQGQRRLVVDRVVDFFTARRRRGNKFLITSRIVGYREVRPTVAGLAECTLIDFGEEEIDLFVDKWTAALERAARGDTPIARQEAARERDELRFAVRNNPGVRRLASNPLLLTILALMKRQGVALPQRRVELYEKYVETLLRHWNLARSLDRPPALDLDPVETVRILAPLALWMHQVSPGVGLVKQGDLQRKLEEILTRRGEPDPMLVARRFLQDVRQHAGLLIERGAREYGFIHLTFQEYLAAVAIAQMGQRGVEPIVETLAAHVGDETWHEVSLLTIGYLGIIQQREEAAGAVVEALLQARAGAPGEPVILAGEAVFDAWPGGVPRRCHARTVEALLAAMRDDVAAPLRAHAGDVLARLGDPRFWTDFYHLPADSMLGFVEIPAGPFLMGSDKQKDRNAGDDETPQHEVELPTYYVARFPVTVAQFRAYVEATGNQSKAERSLQDPATRPVRYVSWHEALSYARWLHDALAGDERTPADLADLLARGWRITLPSEAEWEKAARGTDGRIFPWGDELDNNRLNYRETGIGTTSAVGGFPGGVSPYGMEETSGNVWEWTRSHWGKDTGNPTFTFPYAPSDGREDLSASDEVTRVLRGGAFGDFRYLVRCAYRSYYRPNDHFDFFGFRVVCVPPSALDSDPSAL